VIAVIANLRPTTLGDFGLATAIRMQIEDLQTEGFEASYEDTLGEERLPSTLEVNLFRVAQEALSNVRKHAETDRVCVAIGSQEGVVRLEVRDWGRGFRPSGVRGSAGPGETVGLSSMRDRVALLGGSLQIRSEPGLGTSVVAEIPLSAAGEVEEADDEG
jgi:signal transduction histidine kinase